ncbi:MAG TPA: LysM peptidoglycan-binding domain-containing protein [bacterium]|nr:LysM peptidoglycan-binding domain-containing protein [bacterium]
MNHHSVNLKARLRRHARNSLYQRTTILSIVRKFKVFAAVVVLILPVYPSFGQMAYTQSSVGDYDASSILVSYEGEASDEAGSSILATDTGYLKAAGLLASARDVSGVSTLIDYTVESGDSIAMIADKFRVSPDSIMWANNFPKSKVLHPGDTIKIPPVSGVVYTVESMDTVDAIAKKFKVDAGSISNQNRLAAGSELKIGQKLVIPNARPQEVILAANAPKRSTTTAPKASSKSAAASG